MVTLFIYVLWYLILMPLVFILKDYFLLYQNIIKIYVKFLQRIWLYHYFLLDTHSMHILQIIFPFSTVRKLVNLLYVSIRSCWGIYVILRIMWNCVSLVVTYNMVHLGFTIIALVRVFGFCMIQSLTICVV